MTLDWKNQRLQNNEKNKTPEEIRTDKTEYGMTPRHSEFPHKSREVIGANSCTTCRAVIPHIIMKT